MLSMLMTLSFCGCISKSSLKRSRDKSPGVVQNVSFTERDEAELPTNDFASVTYREQKGIVIITGGITGGGPVCQKRILKDVDYDRDNDEFVVTIAVVDKEDTDDCSAAQTSFPYRATISFTDVQLETVTIIHLKNGHQKFKKSININT